MKTTIVEESKEKSVSDAAFPRLWLNKHTGVVWIETEQCAVVIVATSDSAFNVGDYLLEEEAHSWPVWAFERITTPITIRFEP